MDLTARFRELVRTALGLEADPGRPPALDRLALYPAEVKSATSDGLYLDVQPIDPRVEGHQRVPVRVGVPGEVAVVQAGAVVLLGWERGDPSKPYCVPSWNAGATVTKLVFKASAVHLADESGSEEVITKTDFLTFLKSWQDAAVGGSDGGALMRTNTIAALTAAGWSVGASLAGLGSSRVKAVR